jgi:putative transposase
MYRERKNIRLKNWDYASEGWYFVTICTKEKECFFGGIMDGQMQLSEIGEQAKLFWEEIPQHFSQVELDEYEIMPNHVHGMIGIRKIDGGGAGISIGNPHDTWLGNVCGDVIRDVACNVPNNINPSNPKKNEHMASISPKTGSLSTIVRSFKSALTNWCNKNNQSHFAWQSRFHDHIVRKEDEFMQSEIISSPILQIGTRTNFINNNNIHVNVRSLCYLKWFFIMKLYLGRYLVYQFFLKKHNICLYCLSSDA